MNETEFENYINEMEKFREKLSIDKDLSLELLVKAGICKKNGELAEPYS